MGGQALEKWPHQWEDREGREAWEKSRDKQDREGD